MAFVRQAVLVATYKGRELPAWYRADFVVQNVGLLVNFNTPLVRQGIRRLANNAPNLPRPP